jgi:hypothetical protein
MSHNSFPDYNLCSRLAEFDDPLLSADCLNLQLVTIFKEHQRGSWIPCSP